MKNGENSMAAVDGLYRSVRKVIEEGRKVVSIAANAVLVRQNWSIGKLIVEDAYPGVATLDMLAKRGRGVKVELVTHSNGESAADSYCVFDVCQIAVVGEEMVKYKNSQRHAA